MTIEYSLEQISEAANTVLKNVNHKTLLFKAEMGVGKTTLIKEICKQLGVQDTISSPTYSLVNEYESKTTPIYHFDFYRIKEESEAYDMGFEEYLDMNSWVFIEWPDKIKNLLPLHCSCIKIKLLPDGKRRLEIEN